MVSAAQLVVIGLVCCPLLSQAACVNGVGACIAGQNDETSLLQLEKMVMQHAAERKGNPVDWKAEVDAMPSNLDNGMVTSAYQANMAKVRAPIPENKAREIAFEDEVDQQRKENYHKATEEVQAQDVLAQAAYEENANKVQETAAHARAVTNSAIDTVNEAKENYKAHAIKTNQAEDAAIAGSLAGSQNGWDEVANMREDRESFAVKGSKMRMPARGFITCCNSDITRPVMLESLKAYLKTGGRLIDTAPDYGHEDTVGEAVRASGIPRKEIWLATKVDTDGWHKGLESPKAWALKQVEHSLRKMDLSYLDSITLHFGPVQVAMQTTMPTVGSSNHMGPAEHTEMWRGLIEAKNAGKVLNIGVCETTRSEIENLISQTGETPAVILTWYNPWTPEVQKDYIKWALSKDIAVGAYGLFNFKTMPSGFSSKAAVKAATKAGKAHGVEWGQLVIQWLLEQKVGFVTGMYHPQYLPEDMQQHDFSLTHDDHKLLASVPAQTCEEYKKVQAIPGCFP